MFDSIEQPFGRKCRPCCGGMQALAPEEVEKNLRGLPGWVLDRDKRRIAKEYGVKDFVAAIDFFQRIARVAEEAGHHPDLHLERYRRVRIELYTHELGGLSENDFILAAMIDELPVELR